MTVKWDKDLIITKVREYVAVHGRPPLSRDWYRNPLWPSQTQVHIQFGSWNAAITAAGFVPRQRSHKRFEAEELLVQLREFEAMHGYTPGVTRWQKFAAERGYGSASQFQRVFGTWTNACQCAGLTPNTSGRTISNATRAHKESCGKNREMVSAGMAPSGVMHATTGRQRYVQ